MTKYKVQACNHLGCGSASEQISVEVASLSYLKTPTLSLSSGELSWEEEHPRLDYSLERRPLAGSFSVVTGAASPYKIASGFVGIFRLRACLSKISCSSWSNKIIIGGDSARGANGFYGGNGSVGNPYLIGDYEGLKSIKNDLDAHYRLIADIDANPSQGENGGRGFLPIGDKSSAFRGSFDGVVIGSRNSQSSVQIQLM